LEIGNECRRGKRLCTVHSAVKFGTGYFNGKRSVDKLLLRVTDREYKMRKSGDNRNGLIGIKIGLGYLWLGRDERDLKGIEYDMTKRELHIEMRYFTEKNFLRFRTSQNRLYDVI